ncbi:MAG: TlpA family protein disulfide reductase [Flavobacteriaceae bacterium]|nr:TlpA family protein disulfide reductase [Flavobacteriaceae bacterium]
MKASKSRIRNTIFVVIIALMIIPQTRTPIQTFIQKGIAMISPSVIKEGKRKALNSYNWQLLDLEGSTISFNKSKDNVVLINFWATWCPPCIAEMPSLHKLYDDYKDKVDFYFVSNEEEEVLNKFLKKNDYDFKVQIPKTKYPEAFDVSSIPRTFLIDKKGNIVIDKTGAANWNSDKVRATIDALLNN